MSIFKCFLVSILLSPLFLAAQPYVEGGKTRHRFAQLNLGLDWRHLPGQGSSSSRINPNDGTLFTEQLSSTSITNFVIGGTHFWGHVDFHIAVPLVRFGGLAFLPGVETAAKIYPFRIEQGKLRPYVGAAWQPTAYQQEDGNRQRRHEWPVMAGLTYQHKQLLFDLGAAYSPKKDWDYFVSPTVQAPIQSHPFRFSAGVKWMLETTLSAEKDWQSGRTKIITDTLAKLNRLNSFTIAAGPSSATLLGKTLAATSEWAFLAPTNQMAIFPELGVGYYLHQPDVQFNIAYRNIGFTAEGYGYRQSAKRRALTLEAYKFIGDYHGFVPFIGPALGQEWLRLERQAPGQAATIDQVQYLRPALTFGWDIRPNRIQSFYLRTNLRWYPKLPLKTAQGEIFSFSQLEFNFIQFVMLLNR